MSNSAFTPTVLTISSGAGSGNGEKNYITNPSMASATTGWNVIGDFTLSRSTSSSELPREYTTATGIKLVANNSTTQSAADYLYFDFNLDDVDLNRKLKIQWSQKKIGALLGTHLAVVITSQSDRTTALYTPVTSAIPGVDGDFQTSFDSASTAALSLVIRGTGTDIPDGVGICLSDVIVGPGEIVQGAVVSEWQTYTPTLLNGPTTSTNVGKWRRVGSNMEIQGYIVSSGTGAAATFAVYLPSGYTIDSSALAASTSAGVNTRGTVSFYDGTNILNYATYFYQSGSIYAIRFVIPGTLNDLLGSNFTTGKQIGFIVTVPIAEFSGSGTINLGPGAQVEYAFNSSATTANDTTSFGYGPGGFAIQSFAPSLTTAITKRVQFQYPIQTDDQLIVEVSASNDATKWIPISQVAPFATNDAGSIFYGVQAFPINSTQAEVYFYSQILAGAAWSNWTGASVRYWRVRKAKASAPVGFGLGTVTDSGLVKNRTDSANIAAGDLTWATGTGTITVDAGDILVFRWKIVDNQVFVYFKVGGITLSSTTSSVTVTLPSVVPLAAVETYGTCIIFNNSGSVSSAGTVTIAASSRALIFAVTGTSFAATSNSTYIYGQFCYLSA